MKTSRKLKPERGIWGNLMDAVEDIYDLLTQIRDTVQRLNSTEEVNNLTFVLLAETEMFDDDTAARHVNVFPEWKVGETFKEENGKLPRRVDPLDGKLYKLRKGKDHTSVEGWNPSLTPALWALVDVNHAGTMEDPIPAQRGMEFIYGKYYSDPEDGKLYLCYRAGEAEGNIIVLHYLPHEVVGNYFQEVTLE